MSLAIRAALLGLALCPGAWAAELVHAPLNPRTSFSLSVSVDRADRQYLPGEDIRLALQAGQDCYPLIIGVGPEGQLTILPPRGLAACNPLRAGMAVRLGNAQNLLGAGDEVGLGVCRILVIATAEPQSPLPDAAQARRAGEFVLVGAESAETFVAALASRLEDDRDCVWSAAEVTLRLVQERRPVAARVVAIGVTQGGPGQEKAQFAARDAQAFAAAVKEGLGVPLEHVRLLVEDAATPAAIRAALAQACREAAGETVFVFLSGNGGRRPDDNGDEPDGKDEYVCAWGGQVLDDELAAPGDVAPAPRLLLFLDASFDLPKALRQDAGSMIARRALASEDPEPGGILLREGHAQVPFAAAYSACAFGQSAQESERLQQGIFTYFLVQAIRAGLADDPTSETLAGYLRRSVAAYTNNEQKPCCVAETGP